jgi:hypothetical protein
MHATALKLDHEQDEETLEKDAVDREEVALEDARRLPAQNSARLESSRRGAGSIPPRLRISQTVLAASETPSPTSPPWIRRYPQPGFSRASRRTSSRTSPGVP